MCLFCALFDQFLRKIILLNCALTGFGYCELATVLAGFERQIMCIVHESMQFVAHHETLHHHIAQNETITINHESSKVITM